MAKEHVLDYQAVVIGVSAGGLELLSKILPELPKDFPVPIFLVQHMSASQDTFFADHLNRLCGLRVKEAESREAIRTGTVYIAPGGYHLLVEQDHSLSLDTGARVQYARPSVDVLFMSAAQVYQAHLIGVVLTGANSDGSLGLKCIKAAGGLAIVQDPDNAYSSTMPSEALRATEVDYIVQPNEIAALLCRLVSNSNHKDHKDG